MSGGGRRITWANGLSLSRIVLAILCSMAVLDADAGWAAALFGIAVATDLFDGPVARRRGEASAIGGLVDHSSDALFVSVVLGALALRGEIPLVLPPLVLAAFAQYVFDSRALAGHTLRVSALGRWNGVAYFVLAGAPLVRDWLGWGWPPAPLLLFLGWCGVGSTLLSMLDRAFSARR